MTAKRFRVNELVKYNYSDIGEYIDENHTDKPLRNDELVELLNEQHEEYEELKQAYTQLKHRHSLLHDECIDAECDRDSYRKDIASLEEENEQLKTELKALRKKYNDFSDAVDKRLQEMELLE